MATLLKQGSRGDTTSSPSFSLSLDLHLLATVLPDGDIRSDTILAVVEENDTGHEISIQGFISGQGSGTYAPSGFMDSPV